MISPPRLRNQNPAGESYVQGCALQGETERVCRKAGKQTQLWQMDRVPGRAPELGEKPFPGRKPDHGSPLWCPELWWADGQPFLDLLKEPSSSRRERVAPDASDYT